MKKFRFRLETLLKYYRIQKEEAQLKFSQATLILNEEKNKLTQLTEQLNRSIAFLKDCQNSPVTIENLKVFNSYCDKIRNSIKLQNICVGNAELVQKERLCDLQQAVRNYEAVEKLKLKRLQEYYDETLSEEQKFLDELGIQNYVRKS